MAKRNSGTSIEEWKGNPYYEQILRKTSVQSNTTVCSEVKESDRQEALVCSPEIPRLHTPCHIVVSVWKCGSNWDAGNSESKAIIDSLVKNGIIADDTIKEVQAVTHCGYQAKTRAEEKTEIEIYVLD